jgi:filamentous hemagglutinin family protein
MTRYSRDGLISCIVLVQSGLAGAQTLPAGGHVAGGSASIVPITPSLLTVQQSSSRAVIDWNSFSISQGARVDFQQPSPSAATLNLVTGAQSSAIDGQLTGNGRVYLLNPSGVLIGATGQVNTGSFIAAAASTTPAAASAWQQGAASTLPLTAGLGAVTVQAGAQVVARDGGYIGLAGASVSENGLLYAKLGKVQLTGGSAFTLDFTGDGLLSVAAGLTQAQPGASPTASPVTVGTTGQISAEGGTVSISARAAQQLFSNLIGIDGQVWARNATQSGDVIVLSAEGGGVRLGATSRIDASGTAAGGAVAVTGDSITLEGQSVIATSGATGGGAVTLTASVSVVTSSGSQILTNSTSSGGGGNVMIMGPAGTSLGSASLAGSLIATAGSPSGTAAGGSLSVAATELDFSAPYFTTRPATGAAPLLSLTSVNPMSVGSTVAAAGTSGVSSGALGAALAGGADAVLRTTGGAGSITIESDVNGRPAAASTRGGALTLNAAGDVLLPSGVVATQGGNINVTAGGVLTMQGGASLQAESAASAGTAPAVLVSSAASCATAPAACTTTITDVQAGGGLTVNAAGNVMFAQSLGIPPAGAASPAPTLGSLTVAAGAVALGQNLAFGTAPTNRITVANAISVTAPLITASADLQSANGSITLTGNTTLQAGVYANGPVTFNGDLTLDPRRPESPATTILFQGVDQTMPPPSSEYTSSYLGQPPFYSAVTVVASVYRTTIISGGKGNITFGGNINIGTEFNPNSDAQYNLPPDPLCTACLAPKINLVVDAGMGSVTFSHGLENELSSLTPVPSSTQSSLSTPPSQPYLLVQSGLPAAYALSVFDGGTAANTVRLIETSAGPPIVGSPNGVPATVWVNTFNLNNVEIFPGSDPGPSQVAFVFPQKIFVPSLVYTAGTYMSIGNPPAPSDSYASGVAQMPVTGTGGAGGLSGNAITTPSPITSTPPDAPSPLANAPSAPPGTAATAADSTSPTVTGWNNAPTSGDASANTVQDAVVVVGGRGVGAAADLGRGAALDGAPADVFAVQHHVVTQKPCDPKKQHCTLVVDPTYLNGGARP